MIPQYAIVLGGGDSPRLTPEEVERIFDWSFESHDHTASRPQCAIFWHRESHDYLDEWRYVN